MLEVHVYRQHELFPVEEAARRHFDTHDAALQLKRFHAVCPGALVVLEHLDDVFAVLIFAHEQQLLQVLRLPARLDDVAVGIGAHEGDGFVEGVKVLLRNDRHAGLLELLLAERAIVSSVLGTNPSAISRSLTASQNSFTSWPSLTTCHAMSAISPSSETKRNFFLSNVSSGV